MIGEQHDDKVRAEQGHTRVGDENNNGGPGLEVTVRTPQTMLQTVGLATMGCFRAGQADDKEWQTKNRKRDIEGIH
jgi:hypothetical protein